MHILSVLSQGNQNCGYKGPKIILYVCKRQASDGLLFKLMILYDSIQFPEKYQPMRLLSLLLFTLETNRNLTLHDFN